MQPRENWIVESSPRNLAVRLAREFKLVSALPRLIELLIPLPGEGRKPYRSDPFSASVLQGDIEIAPSAAALIQIGEPVKVPLEAIVNESNKAVVQSTLEKGSAEHHNRRVRLSNIRYILGELSKSSLENTSQ